MEIITDQRFRRTIKYLRALFFAIMIGVAVALLAYTAILLYAKALGPPPLAVPQSSLYYADDGTIIGESHSGEKRYWVPLDSIAPDLIKATIAIEDQSFYEHNGFDYKRIAGAALADLKAMAKVQGASTISQQYARNLFLAHEKTWKRKLLEALYTIRIEMNYTKDEILEGYLNTIYYGEGAYGIQAASQFYFGKNAADLQLNEAALLAGIPKGPSIYSPIASLEKSKKRQQIILKMMVQNQFITENEANTAVENELHIIGKHTHSVAKIAPYFQDAVRNALKTGLHIDERTIELGGLKVFTTLNINQQEIAEKKISSLIAEDSDIQVGFVAMNPKNGHVKAMVGGKNYAESPFNRATQAVRQPGSTIKPFLYYAAIENGFTPATMMRSEQTTFTFRDSRPDYTPNNYNHLYADKEITMAQALALSDNVYAVKTHLFLGFDSLVQTIKKLGITSEMAEVPSLALGTSGIRVIEMANAYSHFANGGKKVTPILITRVENHKGEVIYEHNPREELVLHPDAAYVTTDMMTGMFDRKLNGYTSVTGNTVIDKMTRLYAGKSGSTNTDSWMIGFTPQLVTAVWTGFDQGKPLERFADKTVAKNIWVQFMENALEGEPIQAFQPPRGTIAVYLNPENGKLATKDCPTQRLTYFIAGTEPTEYCTDHIIEEEQPLELIEETEKIPWYKKIFKWS